MRSWNAVLLLWALLVSCIFAWDKDDHEIFRLRDELMKHEGHNVTFYDFLGVKPAASMDDINKAYRKQSRLMHPDKAQQSFLANYAATKAKEAKQKGSNKPASVRSSRPSDRELASFGRDASARFTRLGLIAKILRGEGRDRYDHFLRHGFPAWRGTGYYYHRYRPGAGAVLVGLFVVCGGGFHFGALYLSWRRQRDFVDRYIRHARSMAWGNEVGIQGIPGGPGDGDGSADGGAGGGTDEQEEAVPWNRREKRRLEKENRKKTGKGAGNKAKVSGVSTPVDAELTSGPRGTKKKVVAENGKVLIVDSVGNVFLEEETEEGDVREFLLDANEIPKPTIQDTVLVRVPVWCYQESVGRVLGKTVAPPTLDVPELTTAADEDDAIASATAQNANEEARRRKVKNRVK